MIELLKDRSVLLVKGQESIRFLQNLTTNNLANNIYSYNYLLSPQGKYIHDFFVYKASDEELLIDTHFLHADSLLQRLGMYNLRGAVQIQDVSSKYKMLYSRSQPHLLDGILFTDQDPRFERLGFRTIIKASAIVNRLKTGLDLYTKSSLYLEDKYNFAIPDGVDDLIIDQSLVVQFGAEELSAISYLKGCYIGQEVISRAKYQGKIRKKIFKIVADSKISYAKLGDDVMDLEGNKIGIFCSSYNNLGIVVISQEKYLELEEKSVIIGGNQKARLEIPAWRLADMMIR